MKIGTQLAFIAEPAYIQGFLGDFGRGLAQLGAKYFSEMYHAKISSDDYRKVLDTMAKHADAWVARKDLIAETGLKAGTVTNALNSLKNKNIILVDETRQGFYRLPTKSFAAWISAIKSAPEGAEGQTNLFEAP